VLSALRKNKVSGFTLIELLTVLAVIGLLATIAIPTFLWYLKRARNATAQTDAKNAYTSAQLYFNDYPSGTITSVAILTAYGFRQSAHVVSNVSGTQSTLQITTYHIAGSRTYIVSSEGAMN
jgi:type IV pilus assembly protein PilA